MALLNFSFFIKASWMTESSCCLKSSNSCTIVLSFSRSRTILAPCFCKKIRVDCEIVHLLASRVSYSGGRGERVRGRGDECWITGRTFLLLKNKCWLRILQVSHILLTRIVPGFWGCTVSTHPSLRPDPRPNPNPAPTQTLDLTQGRIGTSPDTSIVPCTCTSVLPSYIPWHIHWMLCTIHQILSSLEPAAGTSRPGQVFCNSSSSCRILPNENKKGSSLVAGHVPTYPFLEANPNLTLTQILGEGRYVTCNCARSKKKKQSR